MAQPQNIIEISDTESEDIQVEAQQNPVPPQEVPEHIVNDDIEMINTMSRPININTPLGNANVHVTTVTFIRTEQFYGLEQVKKPVPIKDDKEERKSEKTMTFTFGACTNPSDLYSEKLYTRMSGKYSQLNADE